MKILLIEDDLDDIELLEEAIQRFAGSYALKYITDGHHAMEYIREISDIPDIIILDVNLPKVDGKDIIREIKSSSRLNNIPLVVLTTSSSRFDMKFAQEYEVDKYLIKPTSVEQIKETVKIISELADGSNKNRSSLTA
jgi:DNA-binding response OmpR family regulator